MISARDGMFIFMGICLGISLSFLWFNLTLINTINSILPYIQIENINFDLNETALVEAVNKTIGVR